LPSFDGSAAYRAAFLFQFQHGQYHSFWRDRWCLKSSKVLGYIQTPMFM
jgi:hypothetical protein